MSSNELMEHECASILMNRTRNDAAKYVLISCGELLDTTVGCWTGLPSNYKRLYNHLCRLFFNSMNIQPSSSFSCCCTTIFKSVGLICTNQRWSRFEGVPWSCEDAGAGDDYVNGNSKHHQILYNIQCVNVFFSESFSAGNSLQRCHHWRRPRPSSPKQRFPGGS